jgi:hypothetical protein
MEGDVNIYGDAGRSLVGSLIGYLVGLFVIIGGFIFAARYLIGKRVERFEQDWRAVHGAHGEDDPKEPPPDETNPPSAR